MHGFATNAGPRVICDTYHVPHEGHTHVQTSSEQTSNHVGHAPLVEFSYVRNLRINRSFEKIPRISPGFLALPCLGLWTAQQEIESGSNDHEGIAENLWGLHLDGFPAI